MNFNLDSGIIVGFLIINLVVGIWSSRGIKNIREYAIGNRNFTTLTLAATVIATWNSGSFFSNSLSETYKEGLWFFCAVTGDIFALSLTAIFLAPRIKEFFDSLSVAEVMGNLYGKRIRIVTAICSIANAVGMTAMQIKVFSIIFSHFLSMSIIPSTLISSFVVIIYSAMGGIRSVTFTDVFQFITFGVCIPILAVFVWKAFGNAEAISQVFYNNPNFDFKELVNYNNPKFLPSLFLFFLFSIPCINASMFQRILMAKSTQQIRNSFLLGAGATLFLRLMTGLIALVVLTHNPNLPPNNVAMYVIDNYAFSGLKGLAIVGLMAMIMSTADSWINTGSVIFAHDLCKPLGIKCGNELLLSRIFAISVGFFAVMLALSAADLLKLLLLQGEFYKPIVTPALLLAILGFRSTTKAVSIGMIVGAISVIIWLYIITPYNHIDGIVPSTLANLVAFVGAHYLLRQPGGWTKTYINSDPLIKKGMYERIFAFSIMKILKRKRIRVEV